ASPSLWTPTPWGTEACPPHPLGNFSGLILGVAGLRSPLPTLRAGAQLAQSVDWRHGRYDAARPRLMAQTPKSVDWWHGRYDAARPRLMALPRGDVELEGDHRERSG
ncbi:MAG: hypothetical protein H7Y37_03495, partial [Anaerolineae bacterium]|nr:hypothetical protein [Gloeobacterales cyanobacterium ES-bin-313]